MKKAAIIILLAGMATAGAIMGTLPVIKTVVLPVIEIPAEKPGDTIAIFISGDGGWRKIDQKVSAILSREGIYVIGLNAMAYFWNKKTPEQTAGDIAWIIEKYSAGLDRENILLIGYSFGADILPFIMTRLPVDSREKVFGAVMMATSNNAIFEVNYPTLTGKHIKGSPTIPEIARIDSAKMLFIGGTEDNTSIVPMLDKKIYNTVVLKGAHHFDRDYDKIGNIILSWYRTGMIPRL